MQMSLKLHDWEPNQVAVKETAPAKDHLNIGQSILAAIGAQFKDDPSVVLVEVDIDIRIATVTDIEDSLARFEGVRKSAGAKAKAEEEPKETTTEND